MLTRRAAIEASNDHGSCAKNTRLRERSERVGEKNGRREKRREAHLVVNADGAGQRWGPAVVQVHGAGWGMEELLSSGLNRGEKAAGRWLLK